MLIWDYLHFKSDLAQNNHVLMYYKHGVLKGEKSLLRDPPYFGKIADWISALLIFYEKKKKAIPLQAVIPSITHVNC